MESNEKIKAWEDGDIDAYELNSVELEKISDNRYERFQNTEHLMGLLDIQSRKTFLNLASKNGFECNSKGWDLYSVFKTDDIHVIVRAKEAKKILGISPHESLKPAFSLSKMYVFYYIADVSKQLAKKRKPKGPTVNCDNCGKPVKFSGRHYLAHDGVDLIFCSKKCVLTAQSAMQFVENGEAEKHAEDVEKQIEDGKKQYTIRLSNGIHKKLRLYASERNSTLSEIAEKALYVWFEFDRLR